MDELELLKRITDYIRQTRADLASELARLEELDIAKVVPKEERDNEYQIPRTA
jgi:hypothetical protein